MSRERRPAEGRSPFAGLFQFLMSVEAGAPSNRDAQEDDDPDFLSSHRLAQGIVDRLAVLENERALAPALVADLLSATPLDAYDRIATRSELATWGVVEQLVRTGRERADQGDPRALDPFDLALALLPMLKAEAYGAACVEDLAGRTWTQLAEARRRLGDLEGAEQALGRSEEHLLEGTGDVLEKAQRFEIEAGVHAARGRISAATHSIDRAIAIFRSTKDRHLAGLARLAKARILRAAGQVEEAVEVGLLAVVEIDRDREPRAAIAAHRALALDLVALGRTDEATTQRTTADRLESEREIEP